MSVIINPGQYTAPTVTHPDAHEFVNRGTASAWDYQIGSGLTADNTWRDLDLSSIVGTGVRWVCFRWQLFDNATGGALQFRENGTSSNLNGFFTRIVVANVIHGGDAWVTTDSSGVCEYLISTGMNSCDLVVRGWFEPNQ